MPSTPIRRLALLVLALSVAGFAGCSDSGTSGSDTAAYRDAGPYVAGVTTLDLGDRQVEVWYPVDPGA